ncbi:sulfite exporter TauE/SafE family protein [Thermodesulfobacteriota bacterium]
MIYIISGVASLFIAFLASILGLGGSFLFIPLFTWLGMDYKVAVIPTALLLNLVSSLTAQTSYIKKDLTDKKVGLFMAAFAVVFAQLGVYLNRFLDEETLMFIFAIMVFVVAIDIVFISKPKKDEIDDNDFHVNMLLIVLAGMFSGTMSGLLGIGGGFIIMPILLLIGFPPKRAAATSSLVVFFSSASALAGHINTQNVDLRLASICVLSVIIGAKFGAIMMSEKFKPLTVRRFFGFVMMLIALKFFLDSI